MKLKTAPMNVADAAKMLRNIAELTARNSQNWENFEQIAAELIKSAYEGGRDSAISPANKDAP